MQAVLLAAVNSGNRKTWQIFLPTFRFGSNILMKQCLSIAAGYIRSRYFLQNQTAPLAQTTGLRKRAVIFKSREIRALRRKYVPDLLRICFLERLILQGI